MQIQSIDVVCMNMAACKYMHAACWCDPGDPLEGVDFKRFLGLSVEYI
jgi:hypothetical protein